jgi:glycosyltransferase involved in cell wall biosynthesis
MRIVLVHPANAQRADGIRDYALQLAAQLCREGDDAEVMRPEPGIGLVPALLRAIDRRRPTIVIVQYNPFSWGRWGLAPSLLLALALVRALRPRATVMSAVHEAYVDVEGLRSAAMGAWQRLQIRVVLNLSHGAFAMTEYLARELSVHWPHRAVAQIPVGSNLTDERASRDEARREAGYDGCVVLGTFATGHITQLSEHALRAASAVAAASAEPVVLLLLGTHNGHASSLSGTAHTVMPGFLDAPALARVLSTVDLFLAPFLDGVSARRTTVMAALQHGLPTLTTQTALSDAVLRDASALSAVSPDDVEGFVARAVELVGDPARREQLAQAGRALFEQEFAWRAICAKVRATVAVAERVRA